MKRTLLILVVVLAFSARAGDKKVDVGKVHGRIQFVTSFPDYKVEMVNSFPDFTIQYVKSFPGPAK
jgi:hypothetical protein